MEAQELARAIAPFLKERENKSTLGIMVGKVISISPYRIRIDEKIILEQEDLVFSASLLKDYSREFIVENIVGNTNSVYDGGMGASSHSHSLTDLSGNIKYTLDLLLVNDEVIIIPTSNLDRWYVIDKVGRLT